MFPSQLDNPVPEYDQIFTCSKEIIEAAGVILSEKRHEVRTVIFPLFMAGFASNDLEEKQKVLNLLLAIETQDYRGSTERTRRLLEKLYERQHSAILAMGNANSVDWIEEVEKSGHRFLV